MDLKTLKRKRQADQQTTCKKLKKEESQKDPSTDDPPVPDNYSFRCVRDILGFIKNKLKKRSVLSDATLTTLLNRVCDLRKRCRPFQPLGALGLTIFLKQDGLLQLLLHQDRDVHSQSVSQSALIEYAMQQRAYRCFKILLEHGCYPTRDFLKQQGYHFGLRYWQLILKHCRISIPSILVLSRWYESRFVSPATSVKVLLLLSPHVAFLEVEAWMISMMQTSLQEYRYRPELDSLLADFSQFVEPSCDLLVNAVRYNFVQLTTALFKNDFIANHPEFPEFSLLDEVIHSEHRNPQMLQILFDHGVEPWNESFADLIITAWERTRNSQNYNKREAYDTQLYLLVRVILEQKNKPFLEDFYTRPLLERLWQEPYCNFYRQTLHYLLDQGAQVPLTWTQNKIKQFYKKACGPEDYNLVRRLEEQTFYSLVYNSILFPVRSIIQAYL